MPAETGLRADDRVKARDLLYTELYHPRDRGLLVKAFLVAAALHVGVLFVRLPEAKARIEPPKAPEQLLPIRRYVPPPPVQTERTQAARRPWTRQMPIAEPAPDAPEPIREPELDEDALLLPPEAEYMIGKPELPPSTGPYLAGVGDVSNPVLIEDSKVQPIYPERARAQRIEGMVTVNAVIDTDGHVSEVEVQRCNRPNLGFEESATAAVKSWRYEPATRDGKPVAVYLTVFVEFKLH